MAGKFPQIGAEAVVKGSNKFFKDVDKVSKKIGDTGKSSKTASKDVGGLGTALAGMAAAATVAGIALKTAFDLGRQAAAVQQTGESFDFLLKKVDAAPDLLDQLNAAAAGTISQMELMASVATLLAGAQGELATALANATPQLLNIAKASNKLNPALGTTTFLFESLARGIKRSSPLILDNLGLVIKIGEANEKFAESVGKTVGELSAQEKQLALLNNVLESGDALINQVGGSTESATDAFDLLTATIQNLKDNALLPAVPIFQDIAITLATWLGGIPPLSQEIRNLQDELIASTDTYEDYVEAAFEAAIANGAIEEGSSAANIGVKLLTKGFLDGSKMVTRWGNELGIASETTRDITKRTLEGVVAIDSWAAAFESTALVLEGITSSTDFLTESLSGLGFTGDEVTNTLLELGLASTTAAGTQERLIEDANLLVEAWDAGVISAIRLKEGLLEAEDGTLKLDAAQRTELQASIAQAAALRDAAAAARDVALAQADLAAKLKDATAAQIAQTAISKLSELAKDASDEDFPNFIQAITDTQAAFGLTDPASVALAETLDIITQALADGILPAEDFDEALSFIIQDAADGKVDLEELADVFFDDLPESIGDTATAFEEGEEDFSEALTDMDENAQTAATNIVTAFETPDWRGLGSNIGNSIAAGITASTPAIAAAAAAAAQAAIDAANAQLGASSPSTEFIGIGKDAMAGMAIGIAGGIGDIEAAMTNAGQATIGAGAAVANSVISGDTNIDRSSSFNVTANYQDTQSPVSIADDLALFAAARN